MKRIKDIILSDKTPMDKNSLWLKDDNLKYFEGVWKNINTSTNNISDIILDNNKYNDIEYLKKFVKQGETWAKNNGTYISEEDNILFSFPVLLLNYYMLIPSIAYSVNNKTIVFPKSQYLSLLNSDSYIENQTLTNKKYIITGNIIIDLNSQYNYCEDTLNFQLDKTASLLEISIPTSTNEKLSAETLAKIQNKLDLNNNGFSCIVNGIIAFCRFDYKAGQNRIIITMSVKQGDPDANSEVEVYKNFDLIINWLIDYDTGEILKVNQQMNGPLIDHETDVGMVKQTSNISALPSNATLNTVISAYNTLLTKLQETGIMAKK